MVSPEIRWPSSWLSSVSVLLLFKQLVAVTLFGVATVRAQSNCNADELTLLNILNVTAAEVNSIAQRALDNEYNCDLLRTCGVSRPPAVLACGNVTPGPVSTPVAKQDLLCVNTVNQPSVPQCGQTNCHNEYLGFNQVAVKLPPGALVHQLTGIPATVTDYTAAVCKQSFLDLVQPMVPPNVSVFGNWRYYADPLGVFSKFPFQSAEQLPATSGDLVQCTQYDPRQRPWFAGSISARKGVVILIDTGSTNKSPTQLIGTGETKLQLSQGIATALINTLQANDGVAVISFNDTAAALDTGALRILTNGSIPRSETDNLVSAINGLQVSTTSSQGLQAAIDLGLSLLSDFVSGCQKILIVLSDGQNFGRFPAFNLAAINETIFNATALQRQPITPFFVSVGEEITTGDATLQQLACSTDGIWMRVPNRDNILFSLYGYFNFLARTSQFVNQTYFSRLYTDASGLGEVFTAARLVFDNVTGDWLGTAAGDTSLDALQNLCPTAKTRVLNTVLQSIASCPVNISTYGLKPCLIPAVRMSVIRMAQNITTAGDNLGYCPTPANCNIPPVTRRCSNASNITGAIFKPPGLPIAPAVNYCCGSCRAANTR